MVGVEMGVEAWMQNLLNDLGWLSKGGWGGRMGRGDGEGGQNIEAGWVGCPPPPPSMNLSTVCTHDEEVELEIANIAQYTFLK